MPRGAGARLDIALVSRVAAMPDVLAPDEALALADDPLQHVEQRAAPGGLRSGRGRGARIAPSKDAAVP
jgi:hypothetical protein